MIRTALLLSVVGAVAAQFNGNVDAIQASSGQLNFLNSLQPQPAGNVNAGGQTFRITGQNLRDIDWTQIDRRAEEAWWHLYPFGERFYDNDIGNRPWKDTQVDLDFFLPFWGFRFNYTFIFPEGFIAFSYPWYIQPPYTYPNPRWPEKHDPSIIAAFMSEQQRMFVGEVGISHVWNRVISRPTNLIGHEPESRQTPEEQSQLNVPFDGFADSRLRPIRYYRGQLLKTQDGRVEDPDLLNRITHDIRAGVVGARGFTADYALLVTWERMGYGGAPKATDLHLYEQVKRWQNTYQLLVATDEIRTYVMFNYANVNWTSSTSAGALFGRGGKQSALVGFNGGNGTGWYQLPYSAEGNSYKLVQFGSTETAGRWLSRVDEDIQYGGCTNKSTGKLQLSQFYGTMLGGFSLNASGPCFRPSAIIKMQLDELTLDCEKINMVVARCVIPVNSVFRTGLVDVKLSTDGGKGYPWWNKFYVLQPSLSRERVNLISDPLDTKNNWKSPWARNLTLTWGAQNISVNPNAQIDITLWGYWEDVEGHDFRQVGYIAERTPNKGAYSFDPERLVLSKEDSDEVRMFGATKDAWRRFHGGVIQVRVADNWMSDRGDGMYWSTPVPFGWYFRRAWEYEYGADWALDICREWFEYDGRRENFLMELEPAIPCPCSLDQALADIGRFTALSDCDMAGDSQCYYTQGAKHCVVSTVSVWTGAGQMCCYDTEGWLMFSDDYEYNAQYLRFYSAGVPYRAHPWGSFPYKRPPYVPSLSNFFNDLMPYEYCCKWAGHCEFYFWRRQSSSCQEYRSPSVGIVYGEPHFVTFDGVKYTFNGKGYYVLSMMKSPHHDLMVQVRMEQPPKTIWNSRVSATVVTGVAARDNSSATIQIFSRKDFRRWRYRMDVYVDGVRIFFDTAWKKLQTFQGVTLRSPPRNMNMSEIDIMFASGVGLRVSEARGLLNIIVSLPPSYNETIATPYYGYERFDGGASEIDFQPISGSKCATHYRSLGLLGTFNNDWRDDLTTPDCAIVSPRLVMHADDNRNVYYDFGEKWRIDGVKHQLLFQTDKIAIYDPQSFADRNYVPIFDPWRISNQTFWETLAFSRDEVRVACQGVPACEFDYLMTGRREIGLDTLDAEKKFEGLKRFGEKRLVSCGALSKNIGVIKHPPGNNYLDGVTVTFNCKPDYFLHGDQQRTCVNGTWSPGWWVWCRERWLEIALKWLVGLLTALGVCAIIAAFFLFLLWTRLRKNKYYQPPRRPPPPRPPLYQPPVAQAKPTNEKGRTTPSMLTPSSMPDTMALPALHGEPTRVGGSANSSRNGQRFAETVA